MQLLTRSVLELNPLQPSCLHCTWLLICCLLAVVDVYAPTDSVWDAMYPDSRLARHQDHGLGDILRGEFRVFMGTIGLRSPKRAFADRHSHGICTNSSTVGTPFAPMIVGTA